MSDEQLRCLEHGPECDGAVEYRMPLSGTGRAFPRCEHHWERRLDEQEREHERDARARRVDWLDAGEVYDDDAEFAHPFEHGAGGGDPDDGYY
jgi:hypothetical protein